MSARAYSPGAALAVVVANMVGTGVFTSLGFQLLDIRSGFVILALWAAGGLAALAGALSYAELGAALPRSGGEYNFLSRIYHPAAGFVAGWISATIGFAAPAALAAMTFAAYAAPSLPDGAPDWTDKAMACALVAGLAILHAGQRRASGGAQLALTALKVVVIAAFCIAVLLAADAPQPVSFLPAPGDGALLTSGAFAVSLIYVGYAYTGWNAATYLSGELDHPQRDLPRVLALGAGLVMALYVALNAVFLLAAPMDAMAGEVEVGYIAAEAAFGDLAARFAGLVLAALLVSTVSAMTLAGPRVLQVIGEDAPMFRALAKTNADGVPSRAVWFQSVLAIGFILTSSFQSVLVFSGFTLSLASFAAVAGVFVLRWRQPDLERPFRTPFYPVTPLVYLALTGWTLGHVAGSRTGEAVAGLALAAAGLVAYAVARRVSRPRPGRAAQ